MRTRHGEETDRHQIVRKDTFTVNRHRSVHVKKNFALFACLQMHADEPQKIKTLD